MLEYVIRRLIYMLITIFAVASILFVVFRLLPGEATLQVISPAMDDAVQDRMKAAFGLDKPLWQQYFIYLKNLVSLEWGRSFVSAQRVIDILQYRFWNTLLLMASGMCMTLVLGIGFGIIMAWKRNSSIDIGGTIAGLVFQAAPHMPDLALLLTLLPGHQVQNRK